MFSGLPRQDDVPFRHLIVAKEVVERTAKATFHGRRAAHARPNGHVAREGDVESLHVHAESAKLLYHAIDVARPCGTRLLRVIDFELHTILQVNGVAHDGVQPVGAHLCHDTLVYCSREDKASVVIRVLADEVNAPRRKIYVAGLSVKMLDEAASHKFYIHRFSFLIS